MDNRLGTLRLGTLATLAITLGVSIAPAPAAAASHVRTALTPTSKDPDARGRANLLVRGSRGKLKIAAQRLKHGATFEVIVDTVRIGTLTTGGSGNGKARFSTGARGRDQLLGVDPRGKVLEVRDEDGDDVLETEMPDDAQPGEIRCCVANHDETECETKSPEECDADHGVNLGAGSCMPNPCANPATDHVRCCVPDHDEDGPECEDLTADACSLAGGVNIGPGDGSGNCENDACGPTPPPGDEIRCCVAGRDMTPADDGDGEHEVECERLTADACAALHGTNLGAGSCDDDPCAASPSGAFLGEVLAR